MGPGSSCEERSEAFRDQTASAAGLTSVHESFILFEAGGAQYVALEGTDFKPKVNNPLKPSPVTVIAFRESRPITRAWLGEYLGELDKDDVFNRQGFLVNIIFTTTNHKQTFSSDFRHYLEELGNQWRHIKIERDGDARLAPGLYYYVDETLRSVCRLYDDTQQAFLCGLKPNSSTTGFRQLQITGVLYGHLAIAVPPRSLPCPASSQSKLRIAVKDCYFLRGLKTSLCNNDYYEMSNPANSTAEVVQKLIEDGAQVLGPTKLSSMLARQEPKDVADFPVAFNPRGDGYQSPAGSSSGSAAAVAAYDWLDCALGTDTSGSGRRPAMANGVWQFRPSHNSVSLGGLVETYDLFDTPCVFARSLKTIKRIMNIWMLPTGLSKSASLPYRLIYPIDYLPVANSKQMEMIDAFIHDAQSFLPATVTEFSIQDSWKQSHPAGTSDNVEEYLHEVIRKTYYYQFYHSTDGFREWCHAKKQRPPYVISFVRDRWDQGAKVTADEHKEAARRLDTYRKWLHEELFGDSSVKTFVVLPVADAKPNYRNDESPSPRNQSARDQLFLPPILGAPDLVVPIGEVPYDSRITEKTEHLPVVVNLVGAPGQDFQLVEGVETILEQSRRPKAVITGPRIFPPKNITSDDRLCLTIKQSPSAC
ncbi:Amidase signature domain [Fusarium albosuccineum]|uniref:Amidase signature domain n=1 Tax=Fusarium albosuccineum TaxID=1237068 RepID=A0A8H4PL68_9HYPO|nr:Amidase signature domain [Fusarium albosuccineum]